MIGNRGRRRFFNEVPGIMGGKAESAGGLVLHNRLKEARAQKKLSQAQLAQLVGVCPATPSVPLRPASLTPPPNWH